MKWKTSFTGLPTASLPEDAQVGPCPSTIVVHAGGGCSDEVAAAEVGAAVLGHAIALFVMKLPATCRDPPVELLPLVGYMSWPSSFGREPPIRAPIVPIGEGFSSSCPIARVIGCNDEKEVDEKGPEEESQATLPRHGTSKLYLHVGPIGATST